MAGVEQNRYKTNNGCIKHLPQTGTMSMLLKQAKIVDVVAAGTFCFRCFQKSVFIT